MNAHFPRRLLFFFAIATASLLRAAAATAPAFSDAVLALALKEDAPRWKFTPGAQSGTLKPTFALQLTAVAAHLTPDRKIGDVTLAQSVVQKLRPILNGAGPDADGHTREPDAVGGIAGWTHNAAAQTLLLAKRTPAIWKSLKPDERHRADLIMYALATAGHLMTDDDNDYHTRLDGLGMQHKSWNPNIAEGYVDIMVAASQYFGAEKLQQFFLKFDFDKFTAELKAANLLNVYRCWNHHPAMRQLFMQGGDFNNGKSPAPSQPNGLMGHGAGVRNPYTYRGHALDEPWAIFRTQCDRMYAKSVRTVVTAFAGNDSRLMQRATSATLSPWEGRMGMCYEFESIDGYGVRTSLTYAFEGMMINLGTAATLRVLGHWPDTISGHDVERRMAVGVSDAMFRAKEGYRGWAGGKETIAWLEKDLQPLGSDFIFPLWSELFPPAPSPN
ncbi:hypothetical protein [Oleiharenicola lentus]|uniref:hypothetical protein n=1 Tax=Oleiharenicola lentus TaxID=2508720 RepID=UPI003F67F060